MRGMLWMDLKRMRWWLLLCFLWGVGFTIVNELLGRTGTSSVFFAVMLPIFGMTFVKRQVFADVQSGWLDHVAMLPNGKQKYAIEKYLLLLCFVPVYILGKSGSLVLYYWVVYGEWLGKFFLYFANWQELLVFFCGFAALQMPVLLLSPKRYSKWETFTWAVLIPLSLWLRNMLTFAYKVELLRGNTISPDTFLKTTNIRWSTLPWEVLAWIAVVLFALSGLFTIWKIGVQVSPADTRMPQRRWGKQAVTLLCIIGIAFAVVWVVDTHTPKDFLYVYTKPNWKGSLTYLTTSRSPEEVAEDDLTEDYTYHAHYEGKTDAVFSYGRFGEQLLLWDGEWLLWDMETDATKKVSIPYSFIKQTEDGIIYWMDALDSEEPLAVGIGKYDEKYTGTFLGLAFFSIPEDRMITDFVYRSYKTDLIDGKIAAETEDGTWVLLDPYTGDVVETLSEEPNAK